MSWRIVFVSDGWEMDWCCRGQNKKTLKRINMRIEAVQRAPFTGIGKPAPLLGILSGYWGRRIDDAHRLIDRATQDDLIGVACRHR